MALPATRPKAWLSKCDARRSDSSRLSKNGIAARTLDDSKNAYASVAVSRENLQTFKRRDFGMDQLQEIKDEVRKLVARADLETFRRAGKIKRLNLIERFDHLLRRFG